MNTGRDVCFFKLKDTNLRLHGPWRIKRNDTRQVKAPVTDLKEVEFYNLPDKELKIIIPMKTNNIKENTDIQVNRIQKQCKTNCKI